MRLRTLAAAAVLAVLLPGLTTTSAQAAAPAHRAAKVTLKNLPASAEVGQKVTLAGTARLARKGKRVKVTVERSYGGGRWQKVATARTSKRGKYAVKVALTQGGTTSFRVKRAGGGTSATDSLAVYQWLDLVDQPFVMGGNTFALRRTTVMSGAKYPRSVEFSSGQGGFFVKPNGLCTSLEIWTGFRDADRAGLAPTARQTLEVSTFTVGGPVVTTYETPVGPAVRRTVPIGGQRYVLATVDVQDLGPNASADGVVGTPRLRCNAPQLPEVSYDELSA